MFVFYDWPFPRVYFGKNKVNTISVLILGSVFSDCVVLYRDIILILLTAIVVQLILWFLSLPSTHAYAGLQDVGNRHI